MCVPGCTRVDGVASASSACSLLVATCALQELLRWYDNDHRRLPWRRSGAPTPAAAGVTWAGVTGQGPPEGLSADDFAYGVWVSEIMLQQTQVTRSAHQRAGDRGALVFLMLKAMRCTRRVMMISHGR